MYRELKRDILKAMSKIGDKDTLYLKGIKIRKDDCQSLMTLCGLFEREGEIAEPWKDKITNTAIAEVLVKYKMW